jgi:hypothetical protein
MLIQLCFEQFIIKGGIKSKERKRRLAGFFLIISPMLSQTCYNPSRNKSYQDFSIFCMEKDITALEG